MATTTTIDDNYDGHYYQRRRPLLSTATATMPLSTQLAVGNVQVQGLVQLVKHCLIVPTANAQLQLLQLLKCPSLIMLMGRRRKQGTWTAKE